MHPRPGLPRFDYMIAETLEKDIAAIRELDETAKRLMHCTDLQVRMPDRHMQPKLLIHVRNIPKLQGIALLVQSKVSLFDPRTLAAMATFMAIGSIGNIGYRGGFLSITIPEIFPSGLPAIATGAVVGVLINTIFLIIKQNEE